MMSSILFAWVCLGSDYKEMCTAMPEWLCKGSGNRPNVFPQLPLALLLIMQA